MSRCGGAVLSAMREDDEDNNLYFEREPSFPPLQINSGQQKKARRNGASCGNIMEDEEITSESSDEDVETTPKRNPSRLDFTPQLVDPKKQQASLFTGALDEIARAVLTVNWVDLEDSCSSSSSSRSRGKPTSKKTKAVQLKRSYASQEAAALQSVSTMSSFASRPPRNVIPAVYTDFRKAWDAWYDPPRGKDVKQGIDSDSYERSLVRMGTVASERDLWRVHEMIDWSNLPTGSMVSFGELGSKPFWEDPVHCNGGRWIIRGCPQKLCEDLFLQLVLSLFGDRLPDPDEFTCVSLQVKERRQGNSVQMWTRNRHYPAAEQLQQRIRDTFAALQETSDDGKRKKGKRGGLVFEFCVNSEAIQRNKHKLGGRERKHHRAKKPFFEETTEFVTDYETYETPGFFASSGMYDSHGCWYPPGSSMLPPSR